MAIRVDSSIAVGDTAIAHVVGIMSDGSVAKDLKATWDLEAENGSGAPIGDWAVPSDSVKVVSLTSGRYKVVAFSTGDHRQSLIAYAPIDIHKNIFRVKITPGGMCTRIGTVNPFAMLAVDSLGVEINVGHVSWALTDSTGVGLDTTHATITDDGVLTTVAAGHFYVRGTADDLLWPGTGKPSVAFGFVIVDPTPMGQAMTCNY